MSITCGYGLITVERHPGRDASWPELYAESLDLVRRAEALGLDSVWTTEHHLVDSGYLPAPLVLSAAFAAVTSRIRIGTGLILAPLYHPLWLAEEAAVVDNLAPGRFILGMGIGWSEVEFEAFGASLATRGRWLDELLDVLDQAGRDEVVRHHGPLIDLPEVAVRPRPSGGRLTVWLGGSAEAALRRAARRADGILLNCSMEDFPRHTSILRDELDRAGRDPADFEIGAYFTIVPDEGGHDAWEEIAHAVVHADWKYSDMGPSARRAGQAIPRARVSDTDVAESRRYVLTGSADAILERVDGLRELAGGRLHLVARNYLPGLSAQHQRELLERFAEGVAARAAAG